MKPRFEEYEGQLFRMLEEPTPLTPDAEMPCLVRLIQDDSLMGRYNRDASYSDVIGKLYVAQKIKENPYYSNTLHAYYKDSNGKDSCIASIHQLEIIGTFVEEGSKDWALYSAMNGKSFVHKDAKQCRIFTMFSERELRVSDGEGETVEYVEIDEFLNDAAKDGWQLYEPEPKPLLADAQVGDLCRRRDGKWVQIDRLLSIGGMPWICYEIGGLRYINNGEQLNSKLSELGIIHTEPLAPEESNEWAWQMLKLGKTVYNPANYYTPSHGLINPNMLGNCSKQSFVGRQEPSGWQLYKEPKIEPPKEPDYVICKRCGGTGYEIKPEPAPKFVVVPISISGTVRQAYNEDGTIDDEQFQLLPNGIWDGTEMFISFDALDSHTRKLVESLLKAQEEEK